MGFIVSIVIPGSRILGDLGCPIWGPPETEAPFFCMCIYIYIYFYYSKSKQYIYIYIYVYIYMYIYIPAVKITCRFWGKPLVITG